jgi:glycogen operon protein
MDWVLPPEEFAPAWRLVVDTSGVPEHLDAIPGGGSVPVASKGLVVLQALAGAEEPVGNVQAAAAVPTIAPVPVPMRSEALTGSESATGPAESRTTEQVSETPEPEAAPAPAAEPPAPRPSRSPRKKKS